MSRSLSVSNPLTFAGKNELDRSRVVSGADVLGDFMGTEQERERLERMFQDKNVEMAIANVVGQIIGRVIIVILAGLLLGLFFAPVVHYWFAIGKLWEWAIASVLGMFLVNKMEK